jgi:hypothetical protein
MGLLSNKGRPSNLVEYVDVEVDNKKYTIGTVVHKDSKLQFIIDFDYKPIVEKYSWHKCSSYISSSYYCDGKKKEIFLHNLIMNKFSFEGKGQKETVDHINRNPLDNRKCNLRIISQSLQNMNQKRRKRHVTLPETYNLNPDDLPKHIFYIPARGNHGDGFCVEFKKEGRRIYNPCIRSNILTIEEKLEKIKVLLQKGYELHQEFNPNYEENIREILSNGYIEIIDKMHKLN